MAQEHIFLVHDNKTTSTKRPLRKRSVILLVFAFLVLLCLLLVTVLPGFYVENINILGAHQVSEEEIIMIARVKTGDHLLGHLGGDLFSVLQMRNGTIEREIRDSSDYIENVSVKIDYPSTIIIEISERLKMAYLEVPDGYAIIDTNGYVLEIERGNPPSGIPLIKGLSVESATLGTQVVLVQQYGLDQNMIILSAIVSADVQYAQSEDTLMSYVRSIRYVEGGISFLAVELPHDNRIIHVKIGSLNNINEDMAWLRHAVFSGVFEDATGSLLDMTGSKHSLR